MYKIVLGMSYYIHSGGLGALVDDLRPVFKEPTEGAGHPLLKDVTPYSTRFSEGDAP